MGTNNKIVEQIKEKRNEFIFIPGNKVISKYIHLIKYTKLSGNFFCIKGNLLF